MTPTITTTYPQKISFREMRVSGVRAVLTSEMAEAELGEAGRQRILHLLPTELIL
jgi:hypothetical protein